MALQRTKLADIQYAPTTPGSAYANPAATKTFVRAITLHNVYAGAVDVKVYNVPDAAGALGTAGVANEFLWLTLAAADTYIYEPAYPIVLTDANDAIFMEASIASAITVMLHGDTDA